MKPSIYWLAIILIALLLPACGERETDGPVTVQGPALIMFYTDG
jgi:hypothetical protein